MRECCENYSIVFQSIGAQEVIGKYSQYGFEFTAIGIRTAKMRERFQPERAHDVAVFVLTQELTKSNGGEMIINGVSIGRRLHT